MDTEKDQPDFLELPELGDREAIRAFARTFNGYKQFGSFRACAEAAKLKERDSLMAIRNELFFSYRASNHRGDFGFVTTYEELYPLFKKLTKNG